MNQLVIGFVDGKELRYDGENADNMNDSLTDAINHGAEWITPTILKNGCEVILATKHITRIAFMRGEEA